MAVQRAHIALTAGHPPGKGHICTDSKYAWGCLTKGWKAKTHQLLVNSLLTYIASSPIDWAIHWVPGHNDLDGNNAADEAANLGAGRSASGRGIDQLDQYIKANNYLAKIDNDALSDSFNNIMNI